MQSFGLNFGDLSQIDKFIEHAQFHSEQYGDNVFVFISKHYGKLKKEHNKEHQEEKEDHEQLPFQHHSSISSVIAFFVNSSNEEFKKAEVSELRAHNFFYQETISSIHLKGLFQPPRQS